MRWADDARGPLATVPLVVALVWALSCAAPAAGGPVQVQVQVDPWCTDSLRVRIGPTIVENVVQGLLQPPGCRSSPSSATSSWSNGTTTTCHGNICAAVGADGLVTVSRVSDGRVVLRQAAPAVIQERKGERDVNGRQLYSGAVAFAREGRDAIYGLGEHKRGPGVAPLSYGETGFRWSFEASQDLATFGDNGDISLPVLQSSSGYMFLWNLPSYGHVLINESHVEWASNSTAVLDFWVTVAGSGVTGRGAPPYGSMMAHYAEAVGPPSDLPFWATGFWQSKMRYRSQDELLAVAEGYLSRGVPLSVIVIDFLHWPTFGTWEFVPECWPQPGAMVAKLASYGIKVMVSVWPQVDPSSFRLPDLYDHRYLIANSSGLPWLSPHTFGAPGYLVDPTSAEARQYLWKAVEEGYTQYGIDIYWLDAAAPQGAVPGQMYLALGRDDQVSMAYPRFLQQTFWDGHVKRGIKDAITLARSTWIGGHTMGGAVWSGDVQSNFTSLAQQIRVAQNMAMSGIFLWTTDIGGFVGGNLTDPVFQELIVRWFQFGAFCPLFRLHGMRIPAEQGNACGGSGGPNEIWDFGATAFAIIKGVITLREQLREYIMHAWKKAQSSGLPLLRPMVFDCADPACSTTSADDQFMFGSDWLVAPVYAYQARSRNVYLPTLAGNATWVHWYSGKSFKGGQNLTAFPAPLDEFPLFVKSSLNLAAFGITPHVQP